MSARRIRLLAVNSPRLLLGLLCPLLALLLLAGVPAAQRMGLRDGALVRVVEAGPKLLWLHRDRAAAPSRFNVGTDAAGFDGSDGDPESKIVSTVASAVACDHALLERIGLPPYPTAPPSHRPCAAPPTGPPASLA